ncbi:RagB/SusD family nutrient uptake outer membrane protein [Terrimonas rubra]|uniref:RagB/SusD family nutrient uptake outer membrane protein n=1 Tax=Terrimonas rubra TaxID=1035890 RepID=A0ABW6A7L0_9BACT
MKLKLYIFLLLALPALISCKKYFEVDNSDRQTIPNTFSTIEGFRASINGTYAKMYNYYLNSFYLYPEVAGNMVDLVKTGNGTMKPQHDFLSDPEEEVGAVGYIWRYAFETIANANNILEYAPAFIEKNPASKAETELIQAQALFVRALSHFDLCRVYAQPYNYTADASHLGVPVVLINPAPEDPVARQTVKVVYAQIIKDLKDAETLFGNSAAANPYVASKKAVQALLARVYLYAEDWDNAITYSTEVINNSVLAYKEQYSAMFNNLIPGVEAIFRLSGQDKTDKRLGRVYAVNDPTYVPADTLMKLFNDPSDIRLGLFQANPANPARYLTRKWTIGVTYTPNNERYDPMVLRASEMYLIRAEAYAGKNRLTDCAADLKIIIARALDKQPADIILESDNKELLLKRIATERAKEFCFEGHNLFDIVRTKKSLVRGVTTTSATKTVNYPSDYFVLPIPQSEMDANAAMVGNPTVNN